jgi:dienelactone hydrolase
MELVGKWRSHATFVADRRGDIQLDRQSPVEGMYSGIDPMGLFWAMEAETATSDAKPVGSPDVREPVFTVFRVEQDGITVATATYRRWFAQPGIRITDIQERGMAGKLFEPALRGRRAAVLVLGGSEGGTDPYMAAAFANKGYVAYALAYFRVPSLPRELVEIPLEYFLSATEWLSNQPSVDPNRIAVYGKSRGAEAALLLPSVSPLYRVAIIAAPSSVTWAGVGPHNAGRPAWTYHGEPVRYVPNSTTAAMLHEAGTNIPEAIPIERSRAAVLLVSGQEDAVWPKGAVSVMSDLIVERLAQHKHPYAYEHLSYPNAGHSFGLAYLPGPIVASGGGTPAGNAKAGADLAPKVWAFLQKHLDGAGRQRRRDD